MSNGKFMSRSLRKTKIFGITTSESEKQDKKRWNRTFGKVCRKLVLSEKVATHKIHSVTEVWSGAKDGKRYNHNAKKRDMRK
ncbi:hypothetical protein [Sphingobacterium sp. UBA3549]|uniref:hypothetical protein n=1 Tax=Sphingobacterium sp. UBA3549 TaxID=1947496 RepID=UPI0025D85862|nr:hypothetical protein [Sphingobacterium sp. UBA3549]